MAARRPNVSTGRRYGHRDGLRRPSFQNELLDKIGGLHLADSTPPPSRPSDVLVIAIDFGTIRTGYAYSFKSVFDKDPLQVDYLDDKNASRMPTCILFTPHRKFAAFGREAEDQYVRLLDQDRAEASKWYFFDRFKMELHRQAHLSRDLTIMDKAKKKSMRGLDVFSAALRFLKSHALQTLQEWNILIKEEEIKWVLTVPAIWTDASRQFMREAATLAGIADDRLVLALEPEAASLYCWHYFNSRPTSGGLLFTGRGRRFMTVDCGGGTVDISVFEVGQGGRLKQLHRPEGAPCGGVKVDDNFKSFLNEILGFDGIASIDSGEMLELMRKLEMSKQQSDMSDRFPVVIPDTLRENLANSLIGSKYQGKANVVKRKLLIDKDIAISFYEESKRGIIQSVRKVLCSEAVSPVDAILLVGGLSESRVIQDAVREAFPEERVLVPPSPSLTVVMGAVQYGHCPRVISTRVAAFTYGVRSHATFIEGEHDEARAKVIEGEKECTEIFQVFIRINDIVSLDQRLPFKTFNPAQSGQTKASFNIYRTRSRSPKYVTEEGCEKIGYFTVEMPDLTGEKERRIQATMCVSGTELKVLARDGNTGKEFSTSCDFLSK